MQILLILLFICLFNLLLRVVSNCVITCFFLCTTQMIFFCFAETMRAPLTWNSATEGQHVIQVLNMLSVQSCSNADLIKCKDHWGCLTLYIPVEKIPHKLEERNECNNWKHIQLNLEEPLQEPLLENSEKT